MKLSLLPRRLLLASILTTGAFTLPCTQVQAQVVSAEAATADAFRLLNENDLKGAADAFENIVKKYPTSLSATDALFRLGYVYFLMGDYDKSLTYIKKVLGPPASPELIEQGAGLLPQALAGKASKEKNDGARNAGYEAAIKEFDAFIQKYPKSAQLETITYARAITCFQVAKYDDAITSLRNNLKQFPNSESILDSQFLLSLCLMTQGGILAQETPKTVNPAADVKFDEAQRLLSEIVTKRSDIALLNDAQFQLGELFVTRALFAPDATRSALLAKGLEAYRSVLPKGPTVEAQKQRISAFRERYNAARTALNLGEMRRIESLIEHEVAKLATVQGKGDLTVSSKIKVGQVFFHKDAFDEARVAFRGMQPFAEDDEQKKNLLYYLTLSYAQQSKLLPSESRDEIIENAVKSYSQFQSAYKGDPLADNLPYIIGTLFLEKTPEKAVEYFQEGIKLYPKGRLTDNTLAVQADAFVRLKKYDEALGTYQNILKQNPSRDLAAAAELGTANVLRATGNELQDPAAKVAKINESINQFKKVIATYAGTPQVEQAAYWVGQLYFQNGDISNAITELTAFTKNFPKSDLLPTAKFSLGQAYVQKKDTATAVQIFKEIATDNEKSEAAPYTYFQRAAILGAEKKNDEIVTLMREFTTKYPDHDLLYNAYDAIAKTYLGKTQIVEAIGVYSEMADQHAKDPKAAMALLTIASLWTQHANAQGPYFAMNEEQRVTWNKDISNSTETAEKLISNYSDSPQVAPAIQTLLGTQKLLLRAKIKTDEDITKYFQQLAERFEDKPTTKSKILFTLASFLYDKDKVKALEQMTAAYDPQLVYASTDLDLYGSALLEQDKLEESAAIYDKLATDFPNPVPGQPLKSPLVVQEAQSISLFGIGKALQKQGKISEAAEKFDTLKKLYPWSPKIMEANFGIAEAAFQEKKYDVAQPLFTQIARANNAGLEVRAKAFLYIANIQEAKNDLPSAIDNYTKISGLYESVPGAASEGLWRGGQLLEKQAATLPETNPTPKEPVKGPQPPVKGTQLKKAAKAYRDLITKYPTSPHVAEAKARLDVLEPAKK